jgi:cellulose biosynthesis protein BcsQ
MVITVCNFKGGVGKSMIAHQLITGFGFKGYEVDPYGSLADRLGFVVRLETDAKELPQIVGRTIFDFGGFDSKLLREAVKISDLIIVPFIPTYETLQATLNTLEMLREYDKPILLVANLVKKQSDIIECETMFNEFFGFEVEIVQLADSVALQTAIADNKSIIEMAKGGGLKAYTYRKAADSINALYNKICYYVK